MEELKMKNERIKRKIAVACFMVLLITGISYAATYPQIMNNVEAALDKIKTWMITIATPAAAIGVITGVLIKKFSFGDTERMLTGRRLIRASLSSYALVVGIDLVLKAITTFVTKKA
jgi:Ni,Fe-hydrogenase I cytochrome b subunit